MRHAFSFTDMSIIQTRHSEARRVASGRGGANGQLPHAASWTELHSGGLFGPDEGDLTAVLSQQADSRSAPSSADAAARRRRPDECGHPSEPDTADG